MSLREAARAAASAKLGRDVSEADLRQRDSVAAIAKALHLEVKPGEGAGKITTTIFESLCEDQLIQPTFVYDFPTEVSPLSKQRADDPDTVERFEFYIHKMEIANAFSELNDPAGAAAPVRGAAEGSRAVTSKRTRWTTTTSTRSSTACRRPAAKASASIAS